MRTDYLRNFHPRVFRHVASSRRVRLATLTAVLSSLGGFALSVALAHRLDLSAFGDFALAMSASALVVGFTHAGLAEPLLSVDDVTASLQQSMRRVSLVGMCGAAAMLTLATLFDSPFVLWSAVSVHGFVLYDLTKTVNMAVGRPGRAAGLEAIFLTVGGAFAALIFVGAIAPVYGFAAWNVAGAIIGYGSCVIARVTPWPGWPSGRIRTGVSLAFGSDYLVGSGSSQLLPVALGSLGQISIVGALRAAGTIMGPVTMLLGMSRTLLIPHLARAKETSGGLHQALQLSGVMTVLALPALAFLAVLPDSIGQLVLGQNWPSAQPLLPYLALEALFIVVAAAPFAGHRAHLAAGRSLVLRAILSLARISVIILTAVTLGATAAAASMALVAFLGCIVWWVSYVRMMNRSVKR